MLPSIIIIGMRLAVYCPWVHLIGGIERTLLELMQQWLKPEMRGPGKAFGLEVPCPEDAPIQDRAVAFSGRQP